MDGNAENINYSVLNARPFSMYGQRKNQNKKHTSLKRYCDKFLIGMEIVLVLYLHDIGKSLSFGWVSIHCELEMGEQDLHAGKN